MVVELGKSEKEAQRIIDKTQNELHVRDENIARVRKSSAKQLRAEQRIFPPRSISKKDRRTA